MRRGRKLVEPCPVCTGMVSITDDDAMARHLRESHERAEVARATKGTMSRNDMLAELGSALRIEDES